MVTEAKNQIKRRTFMQATAGVSAAALAHAQKARAAHHEKIRLAILGCGGRGNWIAKLFNDHGGYEITAVADYFPERAKKCGDNFGVPANRQFGTLSGYKRAIELADVDAVAIITPPYFHPEQATLAVEADKHVYLAKPIAVDVPGVMTVEKTAETAKAKKLGFLIDFQTRANEAYIEAINRIQNGAIGEYTFGEAAYHANRLGVQEPNDGTPEGRLRNWVFDIPLSGDILVEQNIHSLDVMSWIMKTPPKSVSGLCGRKSRTDVGNCNDHFALLYQYPNDVGYTFTSKQYKDGTQDRGITCDIFGANGKATTKYAGDVIVYGKDFYRGKSANLYASGAINNIAEFHRQVTESDLNYDTVPESVRSHVTAIMGRIAAYEKRAVTWDQALKSSAMDADLKGLKA